MYEGTCLIRDTLHGGSNIPDIDFGQVAVCLIDTGSDVIGTRVGIVAFRFNDGDRRCSGVSVQHFEGRHPDTEEIRLTVGKANRVVRCETTTQAVRDFSPASCGLGELGSRDSVMVWARIEIRVESVFCGSENGVFSKCSCDFCFHFIRGR